jgi:hypothetical protein
VTVDVLHTVRMRIIQYLLFISNKELTWKQANYIIMW